MYRKNVLSTIISQIAKLMLKVVVSIVVARSLGATEYGRVTYFLLIAGLICSYGHFGVNHAVSYFAKKDNLLLERQFSSNICYLVINCLAWGVVLGIPPIWSFVFKGYEPYYIFFAVLYIILVYFCKAIESYYVAFERVYIANKISVLGSIITSILLIVAYCFKVIAFKTYLIILIIENFYLVVCLWGNVKISFKPALDTLFIKRELTYGHKVFMAALFGYLVYRVDQIMIENILGKALLGVYTVGVSLAELIFLIPESFASALMGKLLNIDNSSKYKVLCKTTKCCFYICIFLAMIAFLLAPLISYVYGQEYSRAIISFRLLLVGVCFASIAKVIHVYYLSTGNPQIHLYTTGACFFVNLILDCMLIPKYEIEGAAIASTISYSIYGTIYFLLLLVREKRTIKELLVILPEDVNFILSLMKEKTRR